ncbi:MAG TPA: hypothetical protein VHJ58_20620, partial [Vicinamibacterales bacterium]|nr:hypothetical protein [Vicinamibacterales bacterium]
PALIGSRASGNLEDALTLGYQPAMIVMAALTLVAALIAAVFVTDRRRAVALATPAAAAPKAAAP